LNREHLPPHIVQSCFLRNWSLVSTDYRKLPQTKGPDVLEDVKAAYEFVVEKVPEILGGSRRYENVVVVGQSAGMNIESRKVRKKSS
jgi:acetyl esterase/lipase